MASEKQNGAAPLSIESVIECCNAMRGKFIERNKCLFLLGIMTGFRIGEIINAMVGDVYDGEKVKDEVVLLQQKNKQYRKVMLNSFIKNILHDYIMTLDLKRKNIKTTYLFQSRKGRNNPITRIQAHRILSDAFTVCEIRNASTHSMRKTFANETYINMGFDLASEAQLLGHVSLNTTRAYIKNHTRDTAPAIEKLGEDFADIHGSMRSHP